jgi:hypothetical protein
LDWAPSGFYKEELLLKIVDLIKSTSRPCKTDITIIKVYTATFCSIFKKPGLYERPLKTSYYL